MTNVPTTKLGKATAGTNIYFAAIILIGSLWGMQEGTANEIYSAIMVVIGGIGVVRNWLKIANFRGIGEWIKDANTLNYAIAVLVGLVPKAEALVPGLHDLFDGITGGNLSKIITAGFTLLTTIYYLFIKRAA